ncbi:MAG: MBL fold metallo-hydrolase [Candidatus Lernaella stagnicola]|nr:MBL fold metallo-hydrolase [Candidatus Lernaella stagnicola]
MKCDITILVDNNAAPGSGLLPEHGFAALIEADGRRLLFDTGQGEALPLNAARLGVDLSDLDALVFSHGHYDHTGGGLAVLSQQTKPLPVFYGSGAFVPDLSPRLHGTGSRGIQYSTEAASGYGAQLRELDKPHRFTDRLLITGPIPRAPGGSTAAPEEQALAIILDEGLVIVSGCAHAGVSETIAYVCEVTGVERVRAFVGGTHIGGYEPGKVERLVREFAAWPVSEWVVGHCTGASGLEAFLAVMPDRTRPLAAGSRFSFGVPLHGS